MGVHTCCALVASVWICPWTTWVPDTGWAKRIYCSWPAFNWTWRQAEEGRERKRNRSLCTPEHTAKFPARLRRRSRSLGFHRRSRGRAAPGGFGVGSPQATLKAKNPRAQSSWIALRHHVPPFFLPGRGQLVAKAY